MGQRADTGAHVWRCIRDFVLFPHRFSSPSDADYYTSATNSAQKRAAPGPTVAGKLPAFAGE
jgi:hypothetical protein